MGISKLDVWIETPDTFMEGSKGEGPEPGILVSASFLEKPQVQPGTWMIAWAMVEANSQADGPQRAPHTPAGHKKWN